jgi:hypothetical protein
MLISKRSTEFSLFLRLKFYQAQQAKFYCNTKNPKKGLPAGNSDTEKSNKLQILYVFYGLHAGNNQN